MSVREVDEILGGGGERIAWRVFAQKRGGGDE